MLKVRGEIMNELYIVTGGNGHLGNTIIRALRDQGKVVRALILKNDSTTLLESLGCEIIKGDIRDEQTLELLLDSKASLTIIHTAGIVSIAQKKNHLLYDVNVNGTKKLVDLATKKQVHRFIYVSSVHAIPEKDNEELIQEIDTFDPNLVVDSYAKSKAIATQYVLDHVKLGLNAIIVHPSGIIGPNDYGKAHMTMMIEEYLNGYLSSRVDGAYDFVDVRDVSLGIISAINHGVVGECYILSGKRIELKEMFLTLKKLAGKRYHIHVLPFWFAKISAPLAEIYYRMRKLPPIYTKYSLYTLRTNSNFSHDKATQKWGYTPRSLEETLRDTVLFLSEMKRIKRKRVLNWIKTYQPIKQ
jgi:dihydroflavonol-4-reductase